MNSVNFSNIRFPVYFVGKTKPNVVDNKIFTAYTDGNRDVVQVYDDKSVTGNSLAWRRLQLKNSGVTLAPLKKAVFFICDLIKLSKQGSWFIDSDGTLFEYQKTKRVPLVFKPISQIIPVQTGGSIVEVQGIGTRFKTLHAPKGTEKWAGLLLVGVGCLLYGLYDEKQEDTTRMV